MSHAAVSTAELPAAPTFDDLDVVAHVQRDAYCDGCAYNLRGRDVRWDGQLRLALLRCSECGRVHHAGDLRRTPGVWGRRLGAFVTAVWWLGLLGMFALLVLVLIGLAGGSAEETARMHDWGSRARNWDMYELRTRFYYFDMAAFGLTYLVLALVFAGFGSVAMPRWPAVVTWLVVQLPPLLALAVTYALIRNGPAPWHARMLEALTSLQPVFIAIFATAAFVGAFLGRPLMRSLVRLFLPPANRVVLDPLWRADGKPLPIARPAPGAKPDTRGQA